MLIPGLVSITFRKLNFREIVDLVSASECRAVEWGDDIHVPHGDTARARLVRETTLDAGVEVGAYGSYYKFEDVLYGSGPSWQEVLETAVELGAPTIRVWAGAKGSADATDAERETIVAHTRRIADAAAEQEIEIAFEYHGGSLTDTQSSTMRLLRDIDHANVKSLWQPAVGVSHEDRLTGLQELSSRLSNIHCFQWGPGGGRDKRPLDQGEAEWSDYLSVVRAATPAPESRYVLLEFVRDNSEHAFLEDAETLGRWLARANPSPPG